MMILKRSLDEHLKGRLDKKTGKVVTQPCQGEDSKKVKCPTCGIIVKDLRRHTRERHRASKISESMARKRPANSPPLDGNIDGKRQKRGVAPSPAKPAFKWRNADILQLTEELQLQLQLQRSRVDSGGVNREEMVRFGELFMKRAFDIDVGRAPFLVPTDGDCLPFTLSFIRDTNQTKQMTVEGGTGLRKLVVGEALDFIKESSMEALEPIQVATAPKTGGVAEVEWLTRDELLANLKIYRNNGTWAGDLGDLMPQLYASFTKNPIFVIVPYKKLKKIIGYFVKPCHIFNQPTVKTAASAVIHCQNHYEPLIVPRHCMEAWEAICESHETEELAIAAIQVQLSDDDLGGVMEGTSASTTAAEERQQGQDARTNFEGG